MIRKGARHFQFHSLRYSAGGLCWGGDTATLLCGVGQAAGGPAGAGGAGLDLGLQVRT